MVGISPERQAVGLRLYLCLLTAGLLFLPLIGFGQSATLSGSEGSPRAVTFQILDQRRVYFGQHSITLNRIAPPVFPAPVSAPTPAPAIPAQPFANYDLLFCSATVYDGQLSVVQRLDANRGFVAISNINFDYLSIEGFIGGNTFYELIMALDNEPSADADPVTAAWLSQAHGSLTAGVPGYVVVSGTASADDIQALDALHAYFGANASTLEQQYQQRQSQYAAQALQLKLHPPARPNTVINYWPIKSSVYLPGSGQ